MPNETMPSQATMADFIAKASETTAAVDQAIERGDTIRIAERGGVVRTASGPEALLAPKADRETFARLSAFFDAPGIGPILQSSSLCGRIFFCRVLSLGEKLAAQSASDKLVQPDQNSMDLVTVTRTLATLSVACLGFLHDYDHQALSKIRANIGDPAKWPQLEPHQLLESRNPLTLDHIAIPLMGEYLKWLAGVLPTETDLGNSSAPAASTDESS